MYGLKARTLHLKPVPYKLTHYWLAGSVPVCKQNRSGAEAPFFLRGLFRGLKAPAPSE